MRPSTLLALATLLASVAAPVRAETAAAGDPRRGEALFTGSERFANLGAPCLACHGVSGHALARAASFGPDLSAVYAAYGPEALDGALADMPFPSMAPLYAKHVVTPQERADLAAFLREAGQGSPPRLGGAFAAGVAGIALLFLAAVVLVGRKPRSRTSQPGETP